jgi:hypothetical protein
VASLWIVAVDVILVLLKSTTEPPQRALALGALALLAASLVRGFRRGGFPRDEPVIEGLLMACAAWTLGGAQQGQGLFYLVLFFRAQYGTLRDVALVVLSTSLAYLVTAIGVPMLLGQAV